MFNPGLRERHWEQISEIVGFPLQADEGMSLEKLVDMNLENYIPKFETISEAASKEFSLERALEKMKNEWEPVRHFFEKKIYFHKTNLQKNHTIPNTLYTKRKKKRKKKRLEVLKEGRERNWGAIMSFKQSRDIIRSSCTAYVLFMQSIR